MANDWINSVRTIEQARDFVLKVGCCAILRDKNGGPSLWAAIDAPDKRPGESGWGEKMGYVWSWKNALPARYPNEIFYGKRKSGAMLCTMDVLRGMYAERHVAEEELSADALKLLSIVRQDEVTNQELRQLASFTGQADKNRFDKALLELQLTFHITRINRLEIEADTWTPFLSQYPMFAKL